MRARVQKQPGPQLSGHQNKAATGPRKYQPKSGVAPLDFGTAIGGLLGGKAKQKAAGKKRGGKKQG